MNQDTRRSIDQTLAEHMLTEEKRLTTLENEIKSLNEKIDKLEQSVEGLVEAWKTANNLVSFIKWLSGAAIGLTAFLAYMKGWIK